jgi:hypothetical protein
MRDPFMRASLFVLLLCLGCKMSDHDPLAIGRFQVEASRTESCGEAVVLASPAVATFSVYLRKTSDETLLWDDGQKRWPLAREGDGSFIGGASVVMTMDAGEKPLDEEDFWDPDPDPDPASAGCVMQRIDSLVIDLSDETFAGTLSHTFGVQDGSDCSAVVAGPPPLADSLPCAVAFDLDATRLR